MYPSDLEFLPSWSNGKALRVVMFSSFASEKEIRVFVEKLKTTSPHLHDDIARQRKAAPEIKAIWEAMGTEAANSSEDTNMWIRRRTQQEA